MSFKYYKPQYLQKKSEGLNVKVREIFLIWPTKFIVLLMDPRV
jgi:hypothetical protein